MIKSNAKIPKMPWEKSFVENKFGRTELSRQGWYSGVKWRKMRSYILDKEPLCRDCLKLGRCRPAQMVDHIIPIEPDSPNELKFGEDNLCPLCFSCHNKKTLREGTKNSEESLKNGRDLMNRLESE